MKIHFNSLGAAKLTMVAMVFAQNVNGANAADAAHASNLTIGKAIASTVCAACHGANGVSVADHIPNLAGQKVGYLVGQLSALKDGSRKHDVMNPIAAQLSDADIANVAAHFAAQSGAASGGKSAFLPALVNSRVVIPENIKTAFTPYHTVNYADSNSLTIYLANALAIAAANAGKPLPDGAMIIAENDTAKLDADKKPLKDSKGFFIPDKITSYSAMAREAGWGDEIPALLRNENWQYALFNAAKQIRPNINYAECFACHKALSKTSFVFTLKHLAELQKP